NEHPVCAASGLDRLDAKVGICVNPASELPADRVDPAMGIGIWVAARGDVFGVPVPILERWLPLARVEASVGGENLLHILLRHRLVLQAEVGECAGAVEVDDEPRHLPTADLVHVGTPLAGLPELHATRLPAPDRVQDHE